MEKRCSACNTVKDINNFYFSHFGKNGKRVHRGVCKACFNAKNPSLNTPRKLLTNLQIEEIKKLYLDNETLRSIAVNVGVSKSSVGKYVTGLTRKTSHKKPIHKLPAKSIAKSIAKPIAKSIKKHVSKQKFVLVENHISKPEPTIRKLDYSDYTSVLQSLIKDRFESLKK